VPPLPLKKTLASALSASWRVGSLVLVTALIWTAFYQRWSIESWQVPTDYVGDAHEMLARIKAASEGNSIPLMPEVIERLGAPFGADWNAYPTPDKPLLLVLGALAHVIGLFAAANAGLLLAQVSAALAFYFTARWLRCRWEWAWAGALLFSYTYHTFHRGLPHFSFVFTWTVPLGLLAVWLVAQSRRLEWRSLGAVVCIGVAFGLGISTPYNLLFWGQLLLWALIVQWFGARRRANLVIGFTAGVVAVAAFLVTNAEVWIHLEEPESLPLLSRNYGGTERYALKPMEMFIPPQFHRWDWLAFFGHRYSRWSEWRGEPYLPYLGIFGIVGLLWLVAVSVRRLMARQAPPGQALAAGWLLAYATVGGLTNVVAFFLGIQIFRATNRVAIFISALVLAFLVVRLSRLTANWPAPWRIGAALAVAAIGLFDQLPMRWPADVYARMNADARSDLRLGRTLEAALPKGAMIFQLPVMGFPEVVPPHRLADYEHFRLFLTTEDLRFSYGAAKFRSRSRWQRDLENVPVETLVRRLESYGFSALYINRKGYEDRAEKLLQELETLGYTRRLQGDVGNQVVVLLNPKPDPVLPLGRVPTFGRGWHPRPEDGVRWAGDWAALSYFNPHPKPLRVELKFELVGVSPRDVTLEHNDRAVRRVTTGDQPVLLEMSELMLAPGINRFVLRSAEPAKRQGTGRYQLRAFGLKELSLKFAPGQVAGDWSD
jgi:phosphoglycerol transferase